MNDEVEHPSHYDFGPLEAREIIELAVDDFTDPPTIYHVASALKYLLRASRKGGVHDIGKARKHVVWAEAAAWAHHIRTIPAPDYDPADVAFRHGDEFTQPPNCEGVHESTKSNGLGNVETVDNAHPMRAEALRMADEEPCNQPSYPDPIDYAARCEHCHLGRVTEWQVNNEKGGLNEYDRPTAIFNADADIGN